MTVLVCGGRDYGKRLNEWRFAWSWLDGYREHVGPFKLIHGDARGADSVAARWAQLRGVAVKAFPADWSRLGKRAGIVRNQQMLDEGKPDRVIAFPGGRGTAHMVRIAKAAGVPVLEVTP